MRLSRSHLEAVHDQHPPAAPVLGARDSRSWLERVWGSVADRGRKFAPIPAVSIDPLQRAKMLATSLLSERGEASGAAISRELLKVVLSFSAEQRVQFMVYLADGFQADQEKLGEAARAYLADPSPERASRLAACAEPPREELLRRMNMAEGGTAALIKLREEIPSLLRQYPVLSALDTNLRHLFVSWFNRGFLELRQIDWQTPAATLEKLIAYEAVHEIQGWDDLRRRLAPDRRCFAFFHPALPEEPLIFVQVALVDGLTSAVTALLDRDTDLAAQKQRAALADTAIFYSISNCQDGLRGISFGNFLIKQVVEILRAELPSLKHFSTLSPIPGFRKWLDRQLAVDGLLDLGFTPEERTTLVEATGISQAADLSPALQPILMRLCARYLTASPRAPGARIDPVARFHLGNGARLERINWMGNPGARGVRESYGIMVNYLYDPAMIEANHESFVQSGVVARSSGVEALLHLPREEEEPRKKKGKKKSVKA
jgi:malonyl-CoA decarboxylase